MSSNIMRETLANYFKTQPVLKVWLFGSFARGEDTPASDVDLLVVLDDSKPIGLKFYGMWNDLEKILDRQVDLVTEASLADFARENVERDKVLIYERTA
ncbi:MAG: nucleotidyltransferase domain-containing protein [Prevotella sp.]|nr:nucleotidyltransferase domain-containing protein [Prevotella sp.]MBR7053206.1 nucleotidyltransferase domain-containing protein [Prevotella sp.]